jgi:iron uptake system component EfeO
VRRVFIAGLSVAALTAALTGCGSSVSSPDTSHALRAQVLNVKLTDKGCSPAKLTARSGPMTFVVSNGGTKLVDEFEVRKRNGVILGEREDIDGDATGSFTLKLGPGRYVLACPLPMGGGHGTLVVTGDPVSAQAAQTAELAGRAR